MKVRAKTNIKYGLDWVTTGMTFDVNEADLASLGDMVEVVEKPATQPAPVKEEKPAEAEKEPEAKAVEEKPKATTTRTSASRKRKISE